VQPIRQAKAAERLDPARFSYARSSYFGCKIRVAQWHTLQAFGEPEAT
jgi:hypothetical protein